MTVKFVKSQSGTNRYVWPTDITGLARDDISVVNSSQIVTKLQEPDIDSRERMTFALPDDIAIKIE